MKEAFDAMAAHPWVTFWPGLVVAFACGEPGSIGRCGADDG